MLKLKLICLVLFAASQAFGFVRGRVWFVEGATSIKDDASKKDVVSLSTVSRTPIYEGRDQLEKILTLAGAVKTSGCSTGGSAGGRPNGGSSPECKITYRWENGEKFNGELVQFRLIRSGRSSGGVQNPNTPVVHGVDTSQSKGSFEAQIRTFTKGTDQKLAPRYGERFLMPLPIKFSQALVENGIELDKPQYFFTSRDFAGGHGTFDNFLICREDRCFLDYGRNNDEGFTIINPTEDGLWDVKFQKNTGSYGHDTLIELYQSYSDDNGISLPLAGDTISQKFIDVCFSDPDISFINQGDFGCSRQVHDKRFRIWFRVRGSYEIGDFLNDAYNIESDASFTDVLGAGSSSLATTLKLMLDFNVDQTVVSTPRADIIVKDGQLFTRIK
jgi:hypothetical protein